MAHTNEGIVMRRRKRFGKMSLALAAGLFLAERILRRRGAELWPVRLSGWRSLATRLALRRLGYFSPTGIALRLGVRLLRRYFL